MSGEKDIWITGLTEEEKKELDIAKAKSDAKTWRDFFLELIRNETINQK